MVAVSFFPQGFNRKSQGLDLPQVTFQEWAAKEEAQRGGTSKTGGPVDGNQKSPRPRPTLHRLDI